MSKVLSEQLQELANIQREIRLELLKIYPIAPISSKRKRTK